MERVAQPIRPSQAGQRISTIRHVFHSPHCPLLLSLPSTPSITVLPISSLNKSIAITANLPKCCSSLTKVCRHASSNTPRLSSIHTQGRQILHIATACSAVKSAPNAWSMCFLAACLQHPREQSVSRSRIWNKAFSLRVLPISSS